MERTKGTWRDEWLDFYHGWIMDAEGNYLAEIVMEDEEGHCRPNEGAGNARLMASAPELLEACKCVVEEDHGIGHGLLDTTFQQLLDVIAKAEGR